VPWQDGDYQIALVVNGVTRQECSTSEMVHPVESLLETLRSYYALSPGDLVFTGTPEGVGALESGQSVEATLSTPEGKVCSQLHATTLEDIQLTRLELAVEAELVLFCRQPAD